MKSYSRERCHFVEQAAERPDVRPLVVRHLVDHLWTHVVRRAHIGLCESGLATQLLSKPEVAQLGVVLYPILRSALLLPVRHQGVRERRTYVRVQKDIARLDVAVENGSDGVAFSVAMAFLQSQEDVRENVPDESFFDVGPGETQREA